MSGPFRFDYAMKGVSVKRSKGRASCLELSAHRLLARRVFSSYSSKEAELTADESDARRLLDHVTEVVRDAEEAVQATADSISGALQKSRRGSSALDRLSRFTRDAPLPSLALAFVIGLMIARRR